MPRASGFVLDEVTPQKLTEIADKLCSGSALSKIEQLITVGILRAVAAANVPGRPGRQPIIAEWEGPPNDRRPRQPYSTRLYALLAEQYLQDHPIARSGKRTKLTTAVAEVLPDTVTAKQRETVYRELTTLRSAMKKGDDVAAIFDLLSKSECPKRASRKK